MQPGCVAKRRDMKRNRFGLTALLCCAALGWVACVAYARDEGTASAEPVPFWQHRGQWLWFTATPDVQSRQWVLFRRTITIDQALTRLPLAISADSVYRLWVNGELVCIGPARSEATALPVDELDIAQYLRRGVNVLAVEVGFAPIWDAGYYGKRPGLFIAFGEEVEGTKASAWRVHEPKMHDMNAPIVGLRGPLVEVVDGTRVPDGWHSPDFDDRAWSTAVELDAHVLHEGRTLRLREVPLPEVRRVRGQTIRSYERGNGDVGAPYPDTLPPAEGESFVLQLQNETLMPRAPERTGWPIHLKAQHDSVTLDLGEVAVGFLAFEVEGPAGAVLDLGWHATLAADGSVRPRLHVQLRQAMRYTLRQGRQWYVAITPHTIRYVRLVNRGEKPIVIHAVDVLAVTAPQAQAAMFDSSDPVLNRVFEAARVTATNCALDLFTDNPERERNGWFHDGYWTAYCFSLLAGDTAISQYMCRLAPLNRVPHGDRAWIPPFVPRVPPGHTLHSLIMPGHSLFWLMQCHMNFMLDGERPDAITETGIHDFLAICRNYENELGLLEGLPGWQFLDWARMDEHGISVAMNCLYAAALNAAAEMTERGEYHARAVRVTCALNALSAEGFYPDAFVRHEGRFVPTTGRSEPTQYYALWSGVADTDRAARLWEQLREGFVMNNEATGFFSPDQRPRKGLMRAGTYSYMLRLAHAVAVNDAATLARDIRESFGTQVEQGPGTLWEFMGPREHWGSQTQGVAAGVAVHMVQGLLGVRYEAGFKRVTLRPGVESGLSFCRGTVPTPKGPMHVSWSMSDRAFELQYEGPAMLAVTLHLPEAVRAIWAAAPTAQTFAWQEQMVMQPGQRVRVTPGHLVVNGN